MPRTPVNPSKIRASQVFVSRVTLTVDTVACLNEFLQPCLRIYV